MKVFISWSGDLSRQLAEALREWLPNVLQAIEPWMSAQDIEKGARWSADVATELETTRAGILCLTPDNLEAPWLMFEAGALSKTLEKTRVTPYLLGLRPADLKGPLVQFQATLANRQDTRRLLGTLNSAVGEASLAEKQLDKAFDLWWPELEGNLARLASSDPSRKGQVARPEREILEEILALVRDQAKPRREEMRIGPLDASRLLQLKARLKLDLDDAVSQLSEPSLDPLEAHATTRAEIERDLELAAVVRRIRQIKGEPAA